MSNGDPNAAKHLEPTLASSDTQAALAGDTSVDFDHWLREAVAEQSHDQEPPLQDQVIARLADLQTIKRLAAAESPFPQIHQFEILEELGRGGMGVVFLARHRQLGKIRALKVIHADSVSSSVRSRFKREVKAIGQLEHPYIVTAHDADYEGEVPYLVMDYVDGESLLEVQRRLRRQGQLFTLGAACEAVRQACLGVAYAHEKGVTHRDIKPGNLMLDKEGVVRVLDLGLARLCADDMTTDGQEHTQLTHGQQIVGTPDYLSPEQLRSSHEVDGRTDVYALGVTLFTLLTGQPPFSISIDDDFISKASRILNDPVPDVRKTRAEIPKALATLITSSMAKSVEDRPQTATEFANALQQWSSPKALLESLPASTVPPKNRPQDVAPKPQRVVGHSHRLWIALAILVPLILVAGMVFKFALPGNGELLIDVEDPNARVTVVAIQDGEREDLTLTRSSDNTLRLREGRWEVRMEGLDADQFTLSANQVTISKHGVVNVRIERKQKRQSTPLLDPADSSPPDSGPAIAATRSTETNEDQPLSVTKTNDIVFDWSQFHTPWPSKGLLPRPQHLANGPLHVADGLTWQIRPWLPTTKYLHGIGQTHVDVDSSGRYCAVPGSYDCKVIEIETGKVLHTFVSLNGEEWASVSLTKHAQRIAMLSFYGKTIEIRDDRGRMLGRWRTDASNDPLIANPSHGAMRWIDEGNILLVWDDKHASLVDVGGHLIQTIQFAAGKGPPASLHGHILSCNVAVSPNSQQVAFGCQDGKIRLWDFATERLIEFTALEDRDSVLQLAWSPDGTQLGCLHTTHDHTFAMDLWDHEGQRVQQITLASLQNEWRHPTRFCWSPDGRSLAFDNGRAIETSGTLIRDFDLSHSVSIDGQVFSNAYRQASVVSWANENRIDFIANGGPATLQVGRVRSFTPTGRTLPASQLGNLLTPLQLTWMKESGDLGFLVAANTEGELQSIYHQWDANGSRIASVPGRIDVRELRLDSHSGNILVTRPGGFTFQDRTGKRTGQLVSSSVDRYDYNSATWNRAGTAIAVPCRSSDEWKIRIIHQSGSVVCDLLVPSSDDRPTQQHIPSWSLDDKFVAWPSWTEENQQRLRIWRVDQPGQPFIETILPKGIAVGGAIVWSPDFHWMVAGDGSSFQTACVTAFHLQSKQILNAQFDRTYVTPKRAIQWFDSTTMRLGNFTVNVPGDPKGDLELGENLGLDSQYSPLLYNTGHDREVLLISQGKEGQANAEWWEDGRIHESVPIPLPHFDGMFTPRRRVALGDKAAFAAGPKYVDRFFQIDLANHSVDYIGVALDDGSTQRLSPEGMMLDQSSSVGDYLGYVIHYDGGSEVSLTAEQFKLRQDEDAATRALHWVLEVGGSLQIDDSETWLTRHDFPTQISNSLELPVPGSVVGINLTRCMIADTSLTRLENFPALQQLVLRNTPLTSIEWLPKLASLHTLDLSLCRIAELDSLAAHTPNLKSLNVAQTQVDSSIVNVLPELKQLQTLNLSGTQIDRFVLIELESLPSLQQLTLQDVNIAPENIDAFRQKNPKLTIHQ